MYGPPQIQRMTPMARPPAMSGAPNNIQPGMRPMAMPALPAGLPMQPPMGPRPMIGMAAPQQAGMPAGAPGGMNRQQMMAQALRGAIG